MNNRKTSQAAAPARDEARRGFLRKVLAGLTGLSIVSVAAAALRRSDRTETGWQIDPHKCTQCGLCATECVLTPSAVKCVHAYDLCWYCDLCGGYHQSYTQDTDTAAEHQLCPTAAISRTYIENPFYKYDVDEAKCIGCGLCVKGCTAFGNGSLFLQVRHDRCANCNECAIARACPASAFVRVPTAAPYILKGKQGTYNAADGVEPVPPMGRRGSRPDSGGPDSTRAAEQKVAVATGGTCSAADGVEPVPPGNGFARFPLMSRFLAVSAVLAPAAALAEGGRLAQLRPTFTETGHQPPLTDQPPPRSGHMEYVDVGVLLLALCAASFIALRLRSRRWMVALAVFSALYFGFYRLGCICPVGSVQNMAEAIAGRGYTIPLSVVLVFALPLVFTLFFGRTFCAAVCPLGVLQELVVIHPQRLPLHIRRPLELLPWLYLALAVVMAASGGGYLICRYDPFIGIYRLGGPFPIMLFGAALLAVGTVIGRPYCRFLCPYGALLDLCSRVSRRHVSITPAGCVQCRLCENACPYDAILVPTPATPPEPRNTAIRRLLLLLALAPLLIGAGGWLGSRLAVPLSRFADTVNLAEQVRVAEGKTDAPLSVEVDGFRRSREDPARLYERALAIRQRLKTGGGWLGAFTGLVLATSLLSLTIRRTRRDYVPDRGQCLSCTRCFSACPVKPRVCSERLTTGSPPSFRVKRNVMPDGGRGCAELSPRGSRQEAADA